jgi:hypothetical protein
VPRHGRVGSNPTFGTLRTGQLLVRSFFMLFVVSLTSPYCWLAPVRVMAHLPVRRRQRQLWLEVQERLGSTGLNDAIPAIAFDGIFAHMHQLTPQE